MELTVMTLRSRTATALAVALLVGGCGGSPAGGGPGGGPPGGGAAGGGVPGGGTGSGRSSQPAATPTPSSSYPDQFSGTIGGTNGVDSWSGTATLGRLPDADECNQGGAVVCYAIAGGSVVWTVQGVSKTIPLGPATAADGIQLIVADASHPDRNGTYEISVAPTTDITIDLPNGPRTAFDTVRAWVNVIDFPKVTPDWHLAGQYVEPGGCGIDGCGGGQTWTWDLQGTFGP